MRSRLACVVVLALTATAAGQWIDRTIWTPDSMHGIYEYDVLLHNPVTNRAYFGRRHGDPLQIYDASTRTKFVTHRNLYGARSIVHAPGQHRIYIGFAELGIAALDDRADTLVHFLELPIEQVPFARYNSRDSQLYVGSDHYGIIYSVSCGPDTALWQSTAVEEPVAMEYDSTHNRLYVLEQEQTDSMLAVLDCANGSLVACLPGTSPGNAAHDLALNTSLGKLYVLTEQGPRGALRLAVYDTDSLSLLGDVPLPPEWNFEPIGLWLNPVSNFLYVSLANQGVDDGGESLAVVDCRTDSLCGFVCLPRSYGIQALGLDPDRNRVYVCPCADDSVAVLGVPDSITGWIRTGPAASGALYNPASDEVYFPCENDTLYVVDAEADTVKRVVDYSLLTHYSLFYSAAGPKLYSGTHSGLAAIGPADSLLRWTGFPEVVLGCELLYWPELNRLYVPRCDEPVYVYDCNLDAVVDSITLPFDVRLGLAVPEARTLLLPALAGDSIAVVDLFSNHVTGYAAAHAERLGFNPANNTVVAVDEGFSGCVTSVDPSGGSLVARSPSYLLWSAAVNTRDNEVYVTSEHATPLLHVLDGDSLDEVRQIVMPLRDSRLIWVEDWNQLFAFWDTLCCVFDCPPQQVNRVLRVPGMGRDLVWCYNGRNDKLYVAGGDSLVVILCPSDSVTGVFHTPDVSALTWDPLTNSTFAATGDHITVLRDDPFGVEEQRPAARSETSLLVGANPATTSVRFTCHTRCASVLTVFGIAGRSIWRQPLPASSARSSPVPVVWDRTDARGRAVPAGVYICRLDSADGDCAVKLVLR